MGILLSNIAPASVVEFGFKIAVRDDGVYRVRFEDLGYEGIPPRASELILSAMGTSVGLEFVDGGDGFFGSGDSFTFDGRHLAGKHSWFNEYSNENIYHLGLGKGSNPGSSGNEAPSGKGQQHPSPVVEHFERELLRVALPESSDETIETWYWKRLSYLDAQPFTLSLTEGLKPKGIRVSLAGLSVDKAPRAAGLPQHVAELMLDGTLIGRAAWDGQEEVVVEVGDGAIEGALANRKGQSPLFEIRVPKRGIPDSSSAVIDLVLMNWVEIEYATDAVAGRFTISDGAAKRRLLVEGRYLSPLWIKPARRSLLRVDTNQADYLMIAHNSLLNAVESLAKMHRRRGLTVTVVDVEDIYDEFNHGIASPYAIREFIRHSLLKRTAPALRYVLLAGDASWDVHTEAGARRNLVPSMQVQAHDELAASDNGFVTLVGDDWRPDLAIGRIPAVSAGELKAVVRKIIDYVENPTGGEWQRRIGWVADTTASFQDISSQLAAKLDSAGFSATPIFPRKGEVTAAQDQQDLVDAFNEGQLMLHFLGHGSRFAWRTGPPDYRNRSDMFSLENIKQLENQGKLPLVLSMTCSSGPFDHPEVGSIAEAFLMSPGRGAVGVLAASWRVKASQSFSALLFEELTAGGQSVGEAVMRAKARQGETNRSLVESYNLLGDPALSLHIPDFGPTTP